MNNEQIPPPPLGEPKGSPIRHIGPISPISLIIPISLPPPLGEPKGSHIRHIGPISFISLIRPISLPPPLGRLRGVLVGTKGGYI